MSKVVADNFPRSISQYVPDMEFAADVVGDVVIVNLGAPQALDADGILVSASATTTAASYDSSDWAVTFDGSSTHLGESTAGTINGKYGRNLTAVGTAGSNHVVTVSGRDYLGQKMQENFTLASTVAQAGKKAFKYVDTVDVAVGAAGDTFNLGWGDLMGLPYKAEILLSDTEDKVAAAGSITAGIDTDPQTATTGDPRGTFSPASATDASIIYEVRYVCDTSDLHGVEHYNG